jgi:hypothetical protein
MHLPLVVTLARDREDALNMALLAGSSKDTKRKKELIAVRRRLRVLMLAPRFFSRSSRNALTKDASRSSSTKAEGGLRSRACAKRNNRRNVSL